MVLTISFLQFFLQFKKKKKTQGQQPRGSSELLLGAVVLLSGGCYGCVDDVELLFLISPRRDVWKKENEGGLYQLVKFQAKRVESKTSSDCPDQAHVLLNNRNEQCEHDGAFVREILKSVRMITNLLKVLFKMVSMTETETASFAARSRILR